MAASKSYIIKYSVVLDAAVMLDRLALDRLMLAVDRLCSQFLDWSLGNHTFFKRLFYPKKWLIYSIFKWHALNALACVRLTEIIFSHLHFGTNTTLYIVLQLDFTERIPRERPRTL